MTAGPRFSVIIPAYNRADVLPRAIGSVLGQTQEDFELLLIDDGSDDDTAGCVSGYRDPRIRYVKHASNLGQNCALNTGLRLAGGTYVSFLDSDDEWQPRMLESVLRKFESDGDIGCVYTTYEVREGNGVVESPVGWTLEGSIYSEALESLGVDQGSPSSALSVKRECFDVIGDFEPGVVVCQDDILFLRLARQFKVGRIDEVLATMHCDAAERVTDDAVKTAHGYNYMYSTFATEIVKHCGRATMARHLRYSGELFLEAGLKLPAFRNYCRSLFFGQPVELLRHLRIHRKAWFRRANGAP